MAVIEWWSFERADGCGKWIECHYKTQEMADFGSATILATDKTVVCIHRNKTKPEGERPGE